MMNKNKKLGRFSMWLFQENDFDAWKDFTGSKLSTYDDYIDWIDSLSKEAVSLGEEIALIRRSVDWMKQQLRGRENTPENRARITASASVEEEQGGTTLGLTLGQNFFGWSLIDHGKKKIRGSGEAATLREALVAAGRLEK